MVFLDGREVDRDALVALYDSVDWGLYTEDPEGLVEALRNSTFVVTEWDDDGRLIGLARGMSDDVSIFYLQDVLVHPDRQGEGIGRRLLEACLDRFSHVRQKVLLTDDEPHQHRLYESMGYVNVNDFERAPLNAFVRIDM